MIVFVRFTGTRPGSTWYQAQGTNRYAFGQNPEHRLQGVTVADWPALKAKFGAWLLEVPPEKARSNMVLETLVATADLPALDRATKAALIDAGLETLGMVLAEDATRLEEVLPGRVESVWEAIAFKVGLMDAPTPIMLAPVDATANENVPEEADGDQWSIVPLIEDDGSSGPPSEPSEQQVMRSRRKKGK